MSYLQLNFHLVFSTKDRRPLLRADRMPRIREYLGGIIRNLGGQLLAANGTEDHVHMAAVLDQKRALMDVLRDLKSCFSEWVHQEFPDQRDFAWHSPCRIRSCRRSLITSSDRRRIIGR
jgi:putative transposase